MRYETSSAKRSLSTKEQNVRAAISLTCQILLPIWNKTDSRSSASFSFGGPARRIISMAGNTASGRLSPCTVLIPWSPNSVGGLRAVGCRKRFFNNPARFGYLSYESLVTLLSSLGSLLFRDSLVPKRRSARALKSIMPQFRMAHLLEVFTLDHNVFRMGSRPTHLNLGTSTRALALLLSMSQSMAQAESL
jgi:hypothetical protein